MNLVWRECRGRRRAQGPAVVLVALRPCPHAGIVRCQRALGPELGDLTIERRSDRLCRNRSCARRPVAGDVFRPPLDRLDERAAEARALRRRFELCQRLVEKNRRRHESLGARRLDAAQLAVELRRIRLQAREVRVGIRRVSYLVLGVEESRDVEIRADVLNDDVGRVAPAADSHVAVRQRETVERDVVGALHHRDTGARPVRKVRRVDRIEPGEIRANRGGNAVLSGGRSVAEPGTEILALTLINAERGRTFREEPQQVLGDVLEQSGHLRLRAIGVRARRRRCAAWKKGERGAGREGRDSLTARESRSGHVCVVPLFSIVRAILWVLGQVLLVLQVILWGVRSWVKALTVLYDLDPAAGASRWQTDRCSTQDSSFERTSDWPSAVAENTSGEFTCLCKTHATCFSGRLRLRT